MPRDVNIESPLLNLSGASHREVNVKTDDLAGLRPVRVVAGSDTAGLPLEVLVCEWVKAGSPRVEALRKIHSWRVGKRIYPLVVAASDRKGAVWLFGPNTDAAPSDALSQDQAARMLQAALDEPHGIAARQRLSHLQRALSANQIPGIANSGLFASHYVTADSGIRSEAPWVLATDDARPLLSERGPKLIMALGFRSTKTGAHASLLAAGTGGPPRALAVLLDEDEHFDAGSSRFAVSPVAYGLSLAQREEVPWLMVLRGSQIRLYPVSPDVGVGRRGQAETYFETDLALIGAEDAGFLTLVFSAEALRPGGSVEHMLRESGRFATALGVRLRQRVYEEAIPGLAVAVANQLRDRHPDHADDLGLAYRLTLRILFRLLFQAYAEDRGLLPYGRNERYDRNALKTWAIDLVADPDMAFDAASQSMWDDLIQVWRVIDTGDRAWDVPAYDGGLFGTDLELHPEGALLAQLRLSNDVIGNTLRRLLVDTTADGASGAVDFRALSVREFGTIYEGLLESRLSRTDIDMTIDRSAAYVPAKAKDEVVAAAGDVYFHNASGERKATGSFFTPSFAVKHLVERALNPSLDEHFHRIEGLIDKGDAAGAAEAFFDFRVADLAMGSGHFLVAAIDHIEVGMAAFLAEHRVPGVVDELRRLEGVARDALGEAEADYDIEPSALLRRQIARRCIYGVDLNPIAVELARVAVWIHTFVPGLPMSSLNHTLVCANSLTGIGTIEEALASLEPDHKKGMPSLFADEIEQALEDARQVLVAAANTSEATKAEVRQAHDAAVQAAEAAATTRALFDSAVAIRLGLASDTVSRSTDELERFVGQPGVREAVDLLSPAHFPFLFPEVFLRPNGGFDVLIGNPPWEEVKVDAWRWWTLHFPGLMGLKAGTRDAEIGRLEEERSDLKQELQETQQAAEAARMVMLAGPYPGIGTGDIDLYKAFAWRNWQLVRDAGAIGLVLPRSALAGAGTTQWRTAVLEGGTFSDVCFVANTGGWVFEDVHHQYTVALIVATKALGDTVAFIGPFHSHDEYTEGRDKRAQLAKDEFISWSDSASFPRIPDPHSAAIMRQMKTHPRFNDATGFEFRPVRELDATNDKKRGLFTTDLKQSDLTMPVLSGASFFLWEPDFGDPYGWADPAKLIPHLLAKAIKGADLGGSAFHGMVTRDDKDLPIHRPRIAFRSITNSTNQRTAIFCLIPPGVAVVNAAPYLLRRTGNPTDEAYLLGILCSMPFDWYARRWVEVNLNFFLLNPMPVPRPDPSSAARQRVVDLAGRLAAVDDRYAGWAESVGVPVGTLTTEPERSDAIAELDGLAAVLYGLEAQDLHHIYQTFHRGESYSDRLVAVTRHYERWSAES